jgi:FkbM family methyltransferase
MAIYKINGANLDVPDAILTPTISKMLEKGWYEVEEFRAIKAHLCGSDIVLELGSGVGYLAVICAQIVGAKNVTTVEANPALLPVIKNNLSNNEMADVTLIHGVASSQSSSGKEYFNIPDSFWSATKKRLNKVSSRQIEVPALIVDTLLTQIQPTVLIVDVEGAEEDFFYSPLPKHLRLIVLELHPDHYSQETIRGLFIRLFDQGFCYQTQGSNGAVVVFKR